MNGVLYHTDANNNVNNNDSTRVANNLGTISINGNFDQISKENFKVATITMDLGDGNKINAWTKVKWQGNSTQWWPKKSYRIKLFKDENLSEKLKLKLPGSGFKTNSFNLKGNFNDPTAGMNIVNSKIYEQITKSRSNLSNSIVRKMPNYGQIVGIPVEVFCNGLDQGIYTLNTYHEDKLFGLDDKNQNDIAVDGAGNSEATAFSRPIKLSDINDADGFSNRSPEKVNQSVCDRLNELYQIANAKDDKTYYQLENQYLDVPAAIDFLTFSFAINNDDGLRKNVTYISKNGSKWVIMPYDLDSSWNVNWNGALKPVDIDFATLIKRSGNLLLWNIYKHHRTDIINRYKELRHGALSTKNVISLFNDWMQKIGSKNYVNNGKLWDHLDFNDFRHIEVMSPSNLFQAINQRLANVDKQFGLSTDQEQVLLNIYQTKTRNIINIMPDGTKSFDKQTVKFERQIKFDESSDQLVNVNDWNSDNPIFNEYHITQKDGLESTINGVKINTIPSKNVSINDPDVTNLQIIYVKSGNKNGWVQQAGSYAYYNNNQLKKGTDYVLLDSLTRPGQKDWYLIKNGIALSGIQRWMGSLYYFDPISYLRVDNNYVQSQWGSYYLVGPDGQVLDGVQKWMGTYYYFNPVTHLRVDNSYVQSQWGLWYMFGHNGQIVTGPCRWQGSLYYFDPSSYLVVTNDYRVPAGQDRGYLLGSDGRALTGVQKWMGTYYYFDPTTYLLVKNNYVQSQWGLWYMFGNDGKIVTGPYRWQGSLYYFDPSSYLVVTNDYRVPAGQNRGYLLGSDGRALAGVQKWMGTYYYFDPSTYLLVKNNYVQSQWGLWYMFGNDGRIVTGLYKWQGSYYYFDPDTYLVVKNKWIGNRYFGSDGRLEKVR